MNASTSTNSVMGIIIQYDFCTGCHSCETACKIEHGLEQDQFGIKIAQYGPAPAKEEGRWDYFYLPMFTDICDLCADRVEAGKLPSCVHHCQAKVMEYGPIDDLVKRMVDVKKTVIFAPGR